MTAAYVCFFNDSAATEIYTRSLHDALPIWVRSVRRPRVAVGQRIARVAATDAPDDQWSHDHEHLRDSGPERDAGRAPGDRKSTRLNSSHANTSYAVFCLKTKHRLSSTE